MSLPDGKTVLTAPVAAARLLTVMASREMD